MQTPKALRLVAAVSAALLAQGAAATPVRLAFEGIVTYSASDGDMDSDGTSFELPAAPALGSLFSGYFDYETDTPDSWGPANFGKYTGAITALYVTADGLEWSFDISSTIENLVSITNDYPAFAPDLLQPYIRTTQDFGVADSITSAQLNLWSTSSTPFTSDGLPTALPVLSAFDYLRSFSFNISSGLGFEQTYSYGWEGALTSAAVAPPPTSVPEPGSLALLMIGAIILVVGIRKQRA